MPELSRDEIVKIIRDEMANAEEYSITAIYYRIADRILNRKAVK